jgi:hypothetical protein
MDTTALKTQPSPLEFHTQSAANPIGKEIWLIFIFSFFMTSAGPRLLSPFLPIYVRQLGVTSKDTIVERTGRVFGATFVGTRLTAPLEGHLPNRTAEERQLLPLRSVMEMTLVGLLQAAAELVRSTHPKRPLPYVRGCSRPKAELMKPFPANVCSMVGNALPPQES